MQGKVKVEMELCARRQIWHPAAGATPRFVATPAFPVRATAIAGAVPPAPATPNDAPFAALKSAGHKPGPIAPEEFIRVHLGGGWNGPSIPPPSQGFLRRF